MTRTRVLLSLAAVTAALGVWLMLPALPRKLDSAALVDAPIARGAYHVHSNRSDGTGSIREIAAAAGRAGLSFVIVTDHGDGRRQPDPPAYLDGVLVIDAVELSTTSGHVVALGMRPSPYPLGGAPSAVIEDVARLGGISIVAHPDSRKDDLRWTDWSLPFNGIEWLNADSEWRDEGIATLARSLVTYPLSKTGSLARLFDRPAPVIRRWDSLQAQRRVVGLAAGDAHARLNGESTDTRLALPFPGYEQVFRTLSIGIPRLAITGDAAIDAELIIGAIMDGNVFSAIDALARPVGFGFTGLSAGVRTGMGGRLPAGAPVEFSVTSNAPTDARIVLFKDGEPVADVLGAALQHTAPTGPGIYRVEVGLPEAPGQPPVPWIVSNPIYVGGSGSVTPAAKAAARDRAIQYGNEPANWTVEHSPRAQGALDAVPTLEGTELRFRYALGGSVSEGPFVALTMPAGPVAGYDRISFTARATQPMRMSVELRSPGNPPQGERWHRSVYLDETARRITVFFDEMTPRGPTSQRQMDQSRAVAVLLVVDTLNTAPGSSGQMWIDDVAYER